MDRSNVMDPVVRRPLAPGEADRRGGSLNPENPRIRHQGGGDSGCLSRRARRSPWPKPPRAELHVSTARPGETEASTRAVALSLVPRMGRARAVPDLHCGAAEAAPRGPGGYPERLSAPGREANFKAFLH